MDTLRKNYIHSKERSEIYKTALRGFDHSLSMEIDLLKHADAAEELLHQLGEALRFCAQHINPPLRGYGFDGPDPEYEEALAALYRYDVVLGKAGGNDEG
jgi:hypothetical protein